MLEELRETTELIEDGHFRSWDLKSGSLEYTAGVLPIWPRYFVSVDSLWLVLEMEHTDIHPHYVSTLHFVHTARDHASCKGTPVIASMLASVRYRIVTSGLAHIVTKKPQDSTYWPRGICNITKRRTLRVFSNVICWRGSVVVARRDTWHPSIVTSHYANTRPRIWDNLRGDSFRSLLIPYRE